MTAQDMGDHLPGVEAEGGVAPTACPTCHSALYRHGSQRQTYIDTSMHGKRVVIEIDRKRYRCKVCGKTLFEPLPAMDSKRLATTRMVQHIERHCLRKTSLSYPGKWAWTTRLFATSSTTMWPGSRKRWSSRPRRYLA